MTDPEKTLSTRELDERLKAVRERRDRDASGRSRGSTRVADGMGLGMRIAIEMVVTIAVGVGIGLFLDHQLGTKPWLLILCLLLGTAGAFLNVVRAAQSHERRVKELKARKAQKEDGPKGRER